MTDKVFFSADTHFYHKNILRFCDRPFTSVEEMNKTLIESWNNTVKPADHVWFLGDLTMDKRKVQPSLDKLNGQIHFIFGNHDGGSRSIIQKHSNVVWAGDLKTLKVNGVSITLCHYAMRVWNKSHFGAKHLYGHSHGTLEPQKGSLDVGVDSAYDLLGEYKPFSLDEVIHFTSTDNLPKVREIIYDYVEYLERKINDEHLSNRRQKLR